MAGNVYNNLQKHSSSTQNNENADPLQQVAVVRPTSSSLSTPLKDTSNQRFSTPIRSNKQQAGLCLFGDKTATSSPTVQHRTITVYVKNLDSEAKLKLENKLLSSSGIVSFIIDIQRKRATIRTNRTDQEIVGLAKEAGLKGIVVPPHMEGDPSEEENEDTPDYLPEINDKAGSGWFSSLVSWGSNTVDERKEAQRRNEQKKAYMSSR